MSLIFKSTNFPASNPIHRA